MSENETSEGDEMIADVEPHLRTEGEIRELQPRVDFMAERMCQTQGMVLWALKEAGLTVVLLDPLAREIAPDGAALAAAEERGRQCGLEEAAKLFDGSYGVLLDIESIASRIRGLAPRDSGPQFSRPECPGPDCRSCNGEACDLCGAGKTGFHGRCDHDVIDRHRAPRDPVPACDCGAPVIEEHRRNCATRKPRDSGKER